MQRLLSLTNRQINFKSLDPTEVDNIEKKYREPNITYADALQEIYNLTFPKKSYQPLSPNFTNQYLYYQAVQVFMRNLIMVNLIFPDQISTREGKGFSFCYAFYYSTDAIFEAIMEFMQMHKPNNIELVSDKKCITCRVLETQYQWYELHGYLWK